MKIAKNGCKIDLHIHSAASKWKDSGVKNIDCNSIENIDTLINNLKKEDVNLFAITDHDNFDFDLYCAFEEKLKEDTTLFVLPGVEFTVSIGMNNETVHVVTIFDDMDKEKLKRIKSLIFDGKGKYDVEKVGFSFDKYISILDEIGLDIITFVHQKASPSFEKHRKQDLSSTGLENYKKCIKRGYFSALEFKNPNSEIFIMLHNKENQLDIPLFTGSDCHMWELYPREKVENDLPFNNYTYIKSLPTFKGLKMAITDKSRISIFDNFFGVGDYLKHIEIMKNGTLHSIPLSRGINVIIGGNSSGKSALLHSLDGYKNINKTKVKKKNYDTYLSSVNITNIEPITHKTRFEYQGSIRSKFENEKFNIFNDLGIKAHKNSAIINNAKKYCIEKNDLFLEMIKEEASFEQNVNSSITLELKDYGKTYSLNLNAEELVEGEVFDDVIEEVTNLISSVEKVINNPKVGKFKKHFEVALKFLNAKIIKYYNKKNKIANTNIQYNQCIKTEFEALKLVVDTTKTRMDKEISDYNKTRKLFTDDIVLKYISDRNYKIKTEKFNKYNSKEALEYEKMSLKEYKVFEKINSDATNFESLFMEITSCLFIANKTIYDINASSFSTNVKGTTEETSIDEAMTHYLNKFSELLSDKFTKIKVIEDSDSEQHSHGMNAKIYFDLLSENATTHVYMFDQPEDDISQTNIKTIAIPKIKKLAQSKQVIIVTHNPQFIVNIDADNVIYLQKSRNDLEIKSGALEYVIDDCNILDIIAENIEGGTETIKNRWRRYDKN